LEDLGGRIELGDASERIPGQRGAWMRLRFSAAPAGSAEPEPPRVTESPKLATGE